MLGMLRRLGILGPIKTWAAYWGDSDLVDCERIWVHKGELAGLYAHLNSGIASGTGMPELESSLWGKLASDSASVVATPKSSQGSPFERLRYRSRKSMRPSRKKRKRPAVASGADNRAKAAARTNDERERVPEPRRHRAPTPEIERRRRIVAESPGAAIEGLCVLFDNESIRKTRSVAQWGTWLKAWKGGDKDTRHSIESLVSDDKKANEKSKKQPCKHSETQDLIKPE